MDYIHEKTLRDLRPFLVKHINPDEEIQDQISDERIFTKQMIERIKAEKTRSDRCRAMLDALPQRGPTAYGIFLEYLRNSGHDFVADKIRNKEQENTRCTTSICSESATVSQIQSDFTCASQQVPNDTTPKHLDRQVHLSDADNSRTSTPVARVCPQQTEYNETIKGNM